MRTTNIYALASTQVNPECPTVQVGKERLECTSNTYSCMCLHSAQNWYSVGVCMLSTIITLP